MSIPMNAAPLRLVFATVPPIPQHRDEFRSHLRRMYVRLAVVGALIMAGFGWAFAQLVANGGIPREQAPVIYVVCALGFLSLAICPHSEYRRWRADHRARERFEREYPEHLNDPAGRLLRDALSESQLTLADIAQRLRRSGLVRRDVVPVIVQGQITLPPPGIEHVPPQTIRSWVLPAVMAPLGIGAAVVAIGFWTSTMEDSNYAAMLFGMVASFPILIAAGVLLFHRIDAQVEPGCIRFIDRSLCQTRPRVRSYPIQPGTLLKFVAVGRWLHIFCWNGTTHDTLMFHAWHVPGHGRAILRLIGAVRAETPTTVCGSAP